MASEMVIQGSSVSVCGLFILDSLEMLLYISKIALCFDMALCNIFRP